MSFKNRILSKEKTIKIDSKRSVLELSHRSIDFVEQSLDRSLLKSIENNPIIF
jgi:hypothetical protein